MKLGRVAFIWAFRLFVGVAAAHEQYDRLAQPFVFAAQRAGLGHQPAFNRRFLDLGGGDAIAAGFNHRIVAADEIKQAIGIAPDGVAGPDRKPAIA